MKETKYTSRELKLSAAVYATSPELVEYVKENGTLPDEIPPNGFPIAMKKIIEWRGIDLELTEKEKFGIRRHDGQRTPAHRRCQPGGGSS